MAPSSSTIDKSQNSTPTSDKQAGIGKFILEIITWFKKNLGSILVSLGIEAAKELFQFLSGKKPDAYKSLTSSDQKKVDGLRQSLGEVIASNDPDPKEAMFYLNAMATIYEKREKELAITDPEKAKKVREMGQALRKTATEISKGNIQVKKLNLSSNELETDASGKSSKNFADFSMAEVADKGIKEQLEKMIVITTKNLGLEKLDDKNAQQVANTLLTMGVSQELVIQAFTYYYSNSQGLSAEESTNKAEKIVEAAASAQKTKEDAKETATVKADEGVSL
jgi:hypothetical protein